MHILVITLDYPSEESPASCAFIHTRVLAYLASGIETSVFVLGSNRDNYCFEGIGVERGNKDDLVKKLQDHHFDKLLIHFFTRLIYQALQDSSFKKEILVWVHGIEALSWKRRIFNLEANINGMVDFLRYMVINKKQIQSFRRFVEDLSFRKKFIFVSNWMKLTTEKDLALKIADWVIIPNMIDTAHFKYIEKGAEQRNHILILRSFNSRKYANDISIKVIEQLSRNKKIFDQLIVSIFGQGRLFHKLTNRVKHFNNVNIHNKFLNKAEIAATHQKHGIMLIPTRQDAQGVTMCEAMSSGLVPLTSNNTAIPEYLTPECGYLTHSTEELTNAIIQLNQDPAKFNHMSACAAAHIRNICSTENTIIKELDLIRSKPG